MTSRLRFIALVVAALATASIAIFDRVARATADHAPPAAPQKTIRSARPQDMPVKSVSAEAPTPASMSVEVDLFAAKSWYVAPPPPPPPKPTAPPFPYAITGSLSDGGVVTLFLTLGERNFVVRKGDVVNGNYRFDEMVGEQAEFTYLPLDEREYLQIGKIN